MHLVLVLGWVQICIASESSSHLVYTELPFEPAAIAVVKRDLHGVVDVTHLVSAHLILNI